MKKGLRVTALIALLAAVPAMASTYPPVPQPNLQQIISNATAQAIAQYQVEQAIYAMSATNATKPAATAPVITPVAPAPTPLRPVGVVPTPAPSLGLPVLGATQADSPAPSTNAPAPIPAPAPQSAADVVGDLEAWLAANHPDLTNFYGPKEIELELGAVYAQSTGEAGIKLDVTDWGLIAQDVGLGGSVIEANNAGKTATAAAWAHIDYRKVIGNVSGKVYVGPGYDAERDKAMGVGGLQAEYRWTKNLGAYAGVGYAFEGTKAQDRGLIAGGGLNYSFW